MTGGIYLYSDAEAPSETAGRCRRLWVRALLTQYSYQVGVRPLNEGQMSQAPSLLGLRPYRSTLHGSGKSLGKCCPNVLQCFQTATEHHVRLRNAQVCRERQFMELALGRLWGQDVTTHIMDLLTVVCHQHMLVQLENICIGIQGAHVAGDPC